MAAKPRGPRYPFNLIFIDRMTRGPTRIYWYIEPTFRDPGPYRFRVQQSYSGIPDGDDWNDVASTVDTFFAVDTPQRDFAKAVDAHYRVILDTPLGRYISGPASARQWFQRRQLRIGRERLRRKGKALKLSEGNDGYLLVRRRYGPDCTHCLDKHTGDIILLQCPFCFGTGKEGGYFAALSSQFARISPRSVQDQIDPERGNVSPDSRIGWFLGMPLVRTYDVWVDAHSDERFAVHTVSESGLEGKIVIVQQAELRIIPASDIIYTFPLPPRQHPY